MAHWLIVALLPVRVGVEVAPEVVVALLLPGLVFEADADELRPTLLPEGLS